MGVAFVALKRGRGQGGFEGASPQRAVTENPTQPPASFQCNPQGLEELGPFFRVARSGKTAAGIATSLAP